MYTVAYLQVRKSTLLSVWRDSVSMYIIVHRCLSGGTEMYTAVYLEEINIYCRPFRGTEMYTAGCLEEINVYCCPFRGLVG